MTVLLIDKSYKRSFFSLIAFRWLIKVLCAIGSKRCNNEKSCSAYVGSGLEDGRDEEEHEKEADGADEPDDLRAPARLVLYQTARERRAAALAAEKRAQHVRAAERYEFLYSRNSSTLYIPQVPVEYLLF